MPQSCESQDRPSSDALLATQVLQDLAVGRSIGLPTVVVVAHPDDETLGMAARLAAFKHLTIVQLTDGSPRDCRDANGHGFADWQTYAAEREREASRALAKLGLACRRIRCGIPDQESIFRLPALLAPVQDHLRGAGLVFTHPYEGGHPDHDTAALSVQLACDRIGLSGGSPPIRIEFTSYHHRDGRLVTGHFWPDPHCPEVRVRLDPEAAELKRSALAEYRTQADVIDWFCPDIERYRAAPRYDFAQPPPPGIAQYDFFGWSITAPRWLEGARATLVSLQERRP